MSSPDGERPLDRVRHAVVNSSAAWTAALRDYGMDSDTIERVRMVAARTLLTGLAPHEQRQEDAMRAFDLPIVADPTVPADEFRLVDRNGKVLGQFTFTSRT